MGTGPIRNQIRKGENRSGQGRKKGWQNGSGRGRGFKKGNGQGRCAASGSDRSRRWFSKNRGSSTEEPTAREAESFHNPLFDMDERLRALEENR